MYISIGTLATFALLAWFAYVVMPELERRLNNWSSERRLRKEAKAKQYPTHRSANPKEASSMININDIELTADEEEIAKIEKVFRAVEAQLRKMLNGMKKDPAEVTGFLQVLLDMLNDMWAARCADPGQWLKELRRELEAIPRQGEKPN